MLLMPGRMLVGEPVGGKARGRGGDNPEKGGDKKADRVSIPQTWDRAFFGEARETTSCLDPGCIAPKRRPWRTFGNLHASVFYGPQVAVSGLAEKHSIPGVGVSSSPTKGGGDKLRKKEKKPPENCKQYTQLWIAFCTGWVPRASLP